MTREERSFAVYPTALDGRFDVFVLDVPVLRPDDDRTEVALDKAARRAWWQTFHLLGPRGIEPEDFTVCELLPDGQTLGRLVGSGGLTDLWHMADSTFRPKGDETPWTGGWPA